MAGMRRGEQDRRKQRHGLAAHAGMAGGQRGDLEQEHQPHHRLRQQLADPGGMRAHEIDLQAFEVSAPMRSLASRPKPVLTP
jgi:hypothetical protein